MSASVPPANSSDGASDAAGASFAEGASAGGGNAARASAGASHADDTRDARLIFPLGNSNDGFAIAASSHTEKGNPEPVIRELLQNCLDASSGGKPVEVSITIRDVPVATLPALSTYKAAYSRAYFQRKKVEALSAIEEHITERIADALASETMRVLFCRDNGCGLNRDRMGRLLSESNSSKGPDKGGAGSVGLGHLTAFSASDLRYVCYAGRFADDGCELETIASGRAMLAAHMHGERPGGGIALRSPNGTLAYSELERPDLFSPGFEMLTTPPRLLASEVERLGDSTGSVVAICGFDDFREDDFKGTVERISKIAAAHFLTALVDGKMTISVRDESTKQSKTIDSSTIEGMLNPGGRIRAAKGESFPSTLVFRAYHTLKSGKPLKEIGGTKLLFRPLEPGQPTQVNVFRDGMWITKSAPYLERSAFAGVRPFDAVLLPDFSDDPRDMYNLIRASEGPDHMEINLKALCKKERAVLRGMLKQATKQLREAAGELSDETFVPEAFAVFSTSEVREAEILPTSSSRLHRGGTPKPPSSPSPDPSRPRPDSKQRPRRQAPRQGRKVAVASSIRTRRDASGQIVGVDVWMNEHPHGKLGVRVYVDPGSDQTCERLLPSKFVPIKESEDPYEVGIDSSKRHLPLDFLEPLPDAVGLSVEFIRRKG